VSCVIRDEVQPPTASPLARGFDLGDGLRAGLRLARPRDAGGVLALLAGRGVAAGEIDVRRLLAYDPTRRAVMCATLPADGSERVVGIGAIDLEEGAEPDTLVVADGLDERLPELLWTILSARASRRGRRVA